MSELQKIAASLRHCAVGIGHCRECLAYGENRCSELLKRTAADAIEQLLKERERAGGASPSPTEKDGGKAQELYKLGLFVPGCEQQVGECLKRMDFDGKDELLQRLDVLCEIRTRIEDLKQLMTEREDGDKAQELPWKKLHVGQVVWFLWWDDDANAWEIGQEVATAVGYEGFWYSGNLNNPLPADAFVPWDRIGVDAFLTQQAAREGLEAANGN